MKFIVLHSEIQLNKTIIESLGVKNVICFYGKWVLVKTTLIKFCSELV